MPLGVTANSRTLTPTKIFGLTIRMDGDRRGELAWTSRFVSPQTDISPDYSSGVPHLMQKRWSEPARLPQFLHVLTNIEARSIRVSGIEARSVRVLNSISMITPANSPVATVKRPITARTAPAPMISTPTAPDIPATSDCSLLAFTSCTNPTHRRMPPITSTAQPKIFSKTLTVFSAGYLSMMPPDSVESLRLYASQLNGHSIEGIHCLAV
jgi:hypothetical protein